MSQGETELKSVLIVGTGLIGASVGLALKAGGFEGEVAGWDSNAEELSKALEMKAIDRALEKREAVLETDADVVVLATPVLPILDWMQQLAPRARSWRWLRRSSINPKVLSVVVRGFCLDIRWRGKSLAERRSRRRICFAELRGCSVLEWDGLRRVSWSLSGAGGWCGWAR